MFEGNTVTAFIVERKFHFFFQYGRVDGIIKKEIDLRNIGFAVLILSTTQLLLVFSSFSSGV